MVLYESKKRKALVLVFTEMHDWLVKIRIVTCPKLAEPKTDNFTLSKVRKMTKFTSSKLEKLASNLLDFNVNPQPSFQEGKIYHKSLKNYFKS